jgi:LCP family protein required for cell wall assembly
MKKNIRLTVFTATLLVLIILIAIPASPAYMEGGINEVLLIGLDRRPNQDYGRSDTMVLLTLDSDNGAIKLISLMRDMYVKIPGHGSNRINAACVYGGPDLLIDTIEHNFGMLIKNYVCVDFSTLACVIDQLGGIDADIETKTQMSYINGVIKQDNKVLKLTLSDGLLTETGVQTLTGKQAQAYARYRKGGRGDFDRTERQREVIIKCLDKIGCLSIVEMAKLVVNNIGKVETNLTFDEILPLVSTALDLRAMEIKELRIPIDKGYQSKTVKGMSVLIPNIAVNKKAMEDFLFE